MLLRGVRLLAVVLSVFVSTAVSAQEPGFFAGLDASVGEAWGSSSTRDGGAPIAGGGVVDNVWFGNTVGIGGHVGYRWNPSWSTFLSYQYVHGDVRWDAAFPLFGVASRFAGDASSHLVLANVGYDVPLTETTLLRASAGVGVAFNTLSDVVETDRATSLFLSDVADHTETSPAARLGLGLRYALARNAEIGLDAAVTYVGGFKTGGSRHGNLGTTGITPYEIDSVWATSLGVSVGIRF